MNVTMKKTQEYYFIVVEKNPEGIIKNENLLKISRGFFFLGRLLKRLEERPAGEERRIKMCRRL